MFFAFLLSLIVSETLDLYDRVKQFLQNALFRHARNRSPNQPERSAQSIPRDSWYCVRTILATQPCLWFGCVKEALLRSYFGRKCQLCLTIVDTSKANRKLGYIPSGAKSPLVLTNASKQ